MTGELTPLSPVFPLGVVFVGSGSVQQGNPPTKTRPGTRERIEVYRRRAEKGLPLFVDGDYVDREMVSYGNRISFDVPPPADRLLVSDR